MAENKIASTYDPKIVEEKIYRKWMEKGYFHAEADEAKEPYSIVIPPPNITGQLHMGHALDNTLQDILIRWKRMQGYAALWMPGTDHASIATEVKIIEKLAEEGISKEALGREGFLERAWEWKEQYGGRIVEQLKKLGSSLDWERERFTMDEGCSKAVTQVFINLYNKGLIYQGDRIINWCPVCQTALSDAEVEHEEEGGFFWHIAYSVTQSDRKVVIATTRPETMLGDTALAVHPDDERYADMIGKTVILPLIGREIPVIADTYVDREFGTGVVKITPAHDPNDFEVGARHHLPVVRVMNDDGSINENGGKYRGMSRYDAREKIVEDLKACGCLVKVEPHSHNVGHCYRCSTTVEPIVSKQWFVKMQPLAKPAIEAVRSGAIQFVPSRYEKIYFNWMENIRDWCISRQLWWGHRIPAYYCLECHHVMVADSFPDKCSQCGSERIVQDEDVLDTWFSSALWPFSTLGWPEETEALKYFYPTDVLVTGYDIIFFWVARMIFSGIEHMGQIPFKYVLIHGLVRDSQGKKMSKSLGNGVDPLEVIDKYGADALRLSLVTGNAPGNDMRFYWEKVEASRNFCNKIWNAARFILMNMESTNILTPKEGHKELSDIWILSRLNRVTEEMNENLGKFELGIAVQKIYDFIWNEFCDWYIELAKIRLYGSDEQEKESVLYTLTHVLAESLKLLHPFMPFITEELYQFLPNTQGTIMGSEWPQCVDDKMNAQAEKSMGNIMEAIRSIRNLRAEMNVKPKQKSKLYIISEMDERDSIEANAIYFVKLAMASEVMVVDSKTEVPANSVALICGALQLFMPLNELVNIENELVRLNEERSKLQNELDRVNAKLNNDSFVSKAPESVVQGEKEKQTKYQDMMNKVVDQIAMYDKMSRE